MEKKILQKIEMVENCASFFNKYQPLFINDDQLIEVWDCFRASYYSFRNKYDEISDNMDVGLDLNEDQKEKYARQIFKVSVFLSDWAKETNNIEIINLTQLSLSELVKLKVCKLSKIANTYSEICSNNLEVLESLSFTESISQSLEDAFKVLQNMCAVHEMEQVEKKEMLSLFKAEECLNKVDQMLYKYNNLYQGVCSEYNYLRAKKTIV